MVSDKKASKTKSTQSKSTQTRAIRTKPSQTKPTASKATKAKAPKAKAPKAKAAEPKPAQTNRATAKAARPKPAQTKPTTAEVTKAKSAAAKALKAKPPTAAQVAAAKATQAKPSAAKVIQAKPTAAKPTAGKAIQAKPIAGKLSSVAKAKATKAKPARAKAANGSRTPVGHVARPLPDVRAIGERLRAAIPKPESELAFDTPFGLLTATILAAQSTDKVVNQVMPTLLARYPSAHELALSEQADVEQLIVRTGFFRNKAKAIRAMAQKLVADHGGQVPRSIEQMIELPGVARKTANVVLGTAFGISAGFIVDTHVARVSLRLGLSEQTDPVRIEQDLCSLFWQTEWIDMAHRLTLHGRYTCLAKAPQCGECPLNELCASRVRPAEQAWQARAEAEHLRTDAGLRASRGY